MSKELIDDDIRYLRKWLNEENTSPIDRVALATVLNEVVNLRDRMGGSEGLHRINAHKIKFLKDQLAAAQNAERCSLAQIKVLREALEKIVNFSHWDADVRAEERWQYAVDALAQPADASALREMLAQERDRCAEMRNHEDVLAPVGQSAWGEAYQEGWSAGVKEFYDAIRAMEQTK